MAEENKENVFAFKYPINNVITSFVYYNSLLRDTLEYCMKRDKYNVDAYKYKKNGLINELKISSPLSNVLKNNGEIGQKLNDKLNDFAETVYGDDSTILHLSDDGLRVDHAQHMALIEGVITLHEEVNQIIKTHIAYANKNGMHEDEMDKLISSDEDFYRAVVLFTLINELEFQFAEYNKTRSEAKGERTAASNFIEQDLGKLAGLFEFSRKQAIANDKNYTDVLDKVSAVFEMTAGKRQLPEGQKFVDVFKEAELKAKDFISSSEVNYRLNYQICVTSLVNSLNNKKENPQNAADVNGVKN